MPWGRLLTLIVGMVLLVLVLREVDLHQVGGHLAVLGAGGALAVCAVFLAGFVADTASWQLMLASVRLTGAWLYRLWTVRMVGEAFNVILPTTVGGEPVKAFLLKTHHGIGYHEGGASLIMAKTVNLLTLLLFSGIGFIMMLDTAALSPGHRMAAGLGFGALSFGVLGLFAVQRWQVLSRLLRVVADWRFAGPLAAPLARLLDTTREVDQHFRTFYADSPGRFAAALLLAFANWCLGAVELVLVMYLLGHPITLAEAWIVETVAQLVRAGAFFIPAGIGAVEAGMVLIIQLLTGLPALGLAVSAVRRAREVLWIIWGLALGWRYSLIAAAKRTELD